MINQLLGELHWNDLHDLLSNFAKEEPVFFYEPNKANMTSEEKLQAAGRALFRHYDFWTKYGALPQDKHSHLCVSFNTIDLIPYTFNELNYIKEYLLARVSEDWYEIEEDGSVSKRGWKELPDVTNDNMESIRAEVLSVHALTNLEEIWQLYLKHRE